MDIELDLKAQILMLEHVTAALWANFVSNSGPNPVETCQRVARESLATLDGIYERLADNGPNPGLHPMAQAVIHHEERFWKEVEEQVRHRVG